MDRLELVPGDVRGGGNITILKDDFKTDENTNVYGIHLGEESTFVNGKLMTVYNSRLTTYHSSVADKWALTFTAPRVVSPGDTVTVNFTALCGDDAVGSTEARLVLRSIDGETVFWEDTMVISSGSGSFSVTVPSVDDVFCEWVLFISHYFYQNASCHRSVIVSSDLDFDFNVVGDKSILQTGETCNVVGVLTGTIGDDVIGIPGQTVNFYELWTPGLRVSAPIVQSGDTVDIKAQLIDSTDGSLVREAGHTVNVYMDTTPVPTRLDVNFDKTILSYADGDSAYVVVRVYDQYGDAMPNQSVSVSRSDGVSFTVDTDEYGQGYFSYVSQGDGDVTFTFECSNLQETYSVEDCLKVWENLTSTITPNYAMPSTPFELDFTLTRQSGVGYVRIGTNTNNCLLFGQVGGDGAVAIARMNNGSYSNLKLATTTPTVNVPIPVKVVCDGSKYDLTIGNETITNTDVGQALTTLLQVYLTNSNSINNLRVKPL